MKEDLFEKVDKILVAHNFRARHEKVIVLEAMVEGQKNLEKEEDTATRDAILSGCE